LELFEVPKWLQSISIYEDGIPTVILHFIPSAPGYNIVSKVLVPQNTTITFLIYISRSALKFQTKLMICFDLVNINERDIYT
jgi:hypothetical protein